MSDEPAPGPDRDEEALNRWQRKRKDLGGNGEDKHPYRVWVDDAVLNLDRDYLIKGLIERAAFHVIYGPSGDGKTFFTIDMVYSIATGAPWRGRRVKPGLVVYVAAEAGAGVINRFIAWRSRHVGELAARTPLVILTRGTNLMNLEEVGNLIEELRDISKEVGMSTALVVFDTLSRSMPGGDENKAEDMTRAIRAADEIRDELGAGTVVVHHTGNDVTDRPRGSSTLQAAADCVISVVGKVATVMKVRDGTSEDVFPFDLEVVEIGVDSDGEKCTTCLVQHNLASVSKHNSHKRQINASAQVVFDVLKATIAESGENIPATSILPACRAVRVEQWQDAYFRKRPIKTDIKEKEASRMHNARRMAFTRAQDQIEAAKLAGNEAGFWWLI
jgi:KaiC/GvpD/RAD55 family RecA-like ATPase